MQCSAAAAKGEKEDIVSRSGAEFLTVPQRGVVLTLFLGRKRRVVVSHLALAEGDAALAPRRWVLEGTICDGDSDGPAEWLPVYQHEPAGEEGDAPPVGGVRLYKVSPACHRAWQYLRLRLTAQNASPDPKQQWRLSLTGIEVYGTLYDDT